MKKKVYAVPTCRVIPLVIDNHLCRISKWNDGHGGTYDTGDGDEDDDNNDLDGKENSWDGDDGLNDFNLNNDFNALFN